MDLMEKIKYNITWWDLESVNELLAPQSPQFKSKALLLAVNEEWNIVHLLNTPKPMPIDVTEISEMRCKQIVQIFLNHGANVNYVHEDESTFLVACRKSSASIVKMLIDHGADLNANNQSGLLPIQVAFHSRDEDKINLFLDRGISAEDVNRLGMLEPAVRTSTEAVKRLLQLGADVNHILEHGHPVIFDAVHSENLEMVKFLIESGADLNINDRRGNSTLEAAVRIGNLEIVKILLDHGANIDGHKDDDSPISAAAANGHEEIVKLLLDKGARQDNNALIRGIKQGRKKVVEILLESGYDPNCEAQEDVDGTDFIIYPALSYAIQSNNKELVELLLLFGANVNGSVQHEYSPIVIACMEGDKKIVELLLDNGADIDGSVGDTESPISAAAFFGHGEIIQFLLDRGARRCGNTFIVVILHNDEEMVKLLLENGYDPNYVSSIHRIGGNIHNALNWAVYVRNWKIMKLLLDYGAQVDAVSVEGGKTALRFAVESYNSDRFETVQILLDYGADINKECDGQTALTTAVHKRLIQVCKRLVRHMLLIKEQGVNVSEKNLSASKGFEKLEEYQKACEDEMNSLKTSEFDDSNLSYFDIFTIKDVQKLAYLANNRDILKVLKSNDFKNKFPIYGSVIVDHFDKGIRRKQDFELLKRFINYLSARNHDKLPKLPSTFVYELFTYLTEKDVAAIKKL